jgi:mRNA (guanine-N7-)-methyltransferase
MLPDIFLDVKRVAESFGITEVSPFDFMSIQLALHYIIGSKDAAKSFFDRVFRLLKPGGRFVATFPCCHRISRRLRNITPTDETFTEFSFGNSIYRVTFSAEELLKVAPTLGAVVDGKSMELFEAAIDELDFDELAQTVANTWGVQYKFWLVQTIDNQEEFIVPITALEELISEFHASQETRGNFAETLRYYTDRNHSVVEDFLKRGIVLTDEEEEVFSFYRSIVITKE